MSGEQGNFAMIFIQLIAIAIAFNIGFGASDDDDNDRVRDDVTVRVLSDRYSESENVGYTIDNASDTTVLITCAIDAVDGGEWWELSGDVHETHGSKKERVREVVAGQTVKLTFSPNAALGRPLVKQMGGGPYRLSCRYRRENDNPVARRMVVRSREFLVMP